MPSVPLTVVVLTLNEATRIERCLRSIPEGAKVVIVDSYSQDGTSQQSRAVWAALGRSSGDLAIVERVWPGFVEARNDSLKWVQTEWVLWLDADEWITHELAAELQHLDQFPRDTDVFQIPRQSVFLGREIRHGGWYPDRKRRLGRRGRCEWRSGPFGAAVHENLFPKYQHPETGHTHIGTLYGHFGHEPFRDIHEQQDTNERYSTLLAEGLAARWRSMGKKSGPASWKINAKVVVKFIENYVWKLGFLDGYPGLRIALGSCASLRSRLNKASVLLTHTNQN